VAAKRQIRAAATRGSRCRPAGAGRAAGAAREAAKLAKNGAASDNRGGEGGAAMSPFEFVFSLFALLLGLSLAEVLGGLARTLKQWRTVRLGWLTPLLGLLVMLDLTSSWALAYSLRDAIPANFLTLVIGLFVTGLYYLAATLVFPDDASKWPDLDTYFFEHKRQVLGGMLASRVLARAAQFALGAAGWNYFPAFAAFVLLALVAMFARSKKLNIAVLLVFLALYPVFAVLGLVLRI
jgi:hypothetical protein